MGVTYRNMPQASTFPIITHLENSYWVQPDVTMDDTFISVVISLKPMQTRWH